MATSSQFARIVAEATRNAVPLEVMLELTQRCNFRCQHCYLPGHSDAARLPTARLLALLDELAGMGTLFLALTGGEVLLHPDWREIVRRARRLGFAVTLLTNGSLIDEEAAAVLAAAGVGVEVSYYSCREAVFDAIAGVAGAAAAVRRGLEVAHRHGVRLTLKVPVLAANAADVEEVRAFAASLGASCLAFPTVFARRDGDPAPLALALEGAALASYLRHSPDTPTTLPAPPADRDAWPLCAAASRAAAITAAGDVLACPLLAEPAGNLCTSTFRDIWEGSPTLRALRAMRWRDLYICSECQRSAYCGRCPAQALLEVGHMGGPSPSACAHATALEHARGRG